MTLTRRKNLPVATANPDDSGALSTMPNRGRLRVLATVLGLLSILAIAATVDDRPPQSRGGADRPKPKVDQTLYAPRTHDLLAIVARLREPFDRFHAELSKQKQYAAFIGELEQAAERARATARRQNAQQPKLVPAGRLSSREAAQSQIAQHRQAHEQYRRALADVGAKYQPMFRTAQARLRLEPGWAESHIRKSLPRGWTIHTAKNNALSIQPPQQEETEPAADKGDIVLHAPFQEGAVGFEGASQALHNGWFDLEGATDSPQLDAVHVRAWALGVLLDSDSRSWAAINQPIDLPDEHRRVRVTVTYDYSANAQTSCCLVAGVALGEFSLRCGTSAGLGNLSTKKSQTSAAFAVFLSEGEFSQPSAIGRIISTTVTVPPQSRLWIQFRATAIAEMYDVGTYDSEVYANIREIRIDYLD